MLLTSLIDPETKDYVHKNHCAPAPIEVGDSIRIASKAEVNELLQNARLPAPDYASMGLKGLVTWSGPAGIRVKTTAGNDFFKPSYARRITN